MSLNYVVTKRVLGFDETKSEKFVVKSVSSGVVSYDKLCVKVSRLCGVHKSIAKLVVEGLIDIASEEIDDGKTVKLGEFGTFRPSINAKAVDEESDANANSIKRLKIVFTPGKVFKNTLNDMSVTRYATPDTDWTDGSSTTGGTGNNNPGGGNGDDDDWQDPDA